MGMSRSENMRHIRSQDTSPEMTVRRLAHGLGYRYRLHRKDMPGKPDLVFSGRRKVIFVHGCFWHQHSQCREGRLPKSNADYWLPKLNRNIERDKTARVQLAASGWDVLVIWECETEDHESISQTLRDFLGPLNLAGKTMRHGNTKKAHESIKNKK